VSKNDKGGSGRTRSLSRTKRANLREKDSRGPVADSMDSKTKKKRRVPPTAWGGRNDVWKNFKRPGLTRREKSTRKGDLPPLLRTNLRQESLDAAEDAKLQGTTQEEKKGNLGQNFFLENPKTSVF